MLADKKVGTSTNLKTVQTEIMTEPIRPRVLHLRTTNDQKFDEALVDQYPEVFKNISSKIHGYECKIRLKNDTPICVKPYLIPIAKVDAVEKELKRMIELDIIERSRPQYSIPIVPVFKKKWRRKTVLRRKINQQSNRSRL